MGFGEVNLKVKPSFISWWFSFLLTAVVRENTSVDNKLVSCADYLEGGVWVALSGG